ncbi:hypothetical protein AGLY_002993 [Aphis glycines]|uniref:Uncharacterized protein n=1 Tax=Aphis glycines TaxID=307491 RepID=A0A6G0U470_APHGL|nr:hypothetical protein AGLY_002993 [Aphis glycines]
MAIAVLIYTCAGEMDIYVDVDLPFQRCQFGDVRTVANRNRVLQKKHSAMIYTYHQNHLDTGKTMGCDAKSNILRFTLYNSLNLLCVQLAIHKSQWFTSSIDYTVFIVYLLEFPVFLLWHGPLGYQNYIEILMQIVKLKAIIDNEIDQRWHYGSVIVNEFKRVINWLHRKLTLDCRRSVLAHEHLKHVGGVVEHDRPLINNKQTSGLSNF